MAVIDDILSGYEALRPDQEAFYQDLHRHPELSHQEHHTARRIGDHVQLPGHRQRHRRHRPGGQVLRRALR